MVKKMRILQIVTSMDRGGLETMLMNYYRQINREQILFDFLVHRDYEADYDEEIQRLGGEIYRLPRLNPMSRQYLKKLDEFFQKQNYQIVHSHLDCMSTYPLKAAEKAAVPVRIAHTHNKSQELNLKYPLKIWSKKKIPQYATHLFSCGKAAGEWTFEDSEFKIIPNAIDTEKFQYDETKRNKVRKKLDISDKLVLGHVGRFYKQKNHRFLLDIFQQVKLQEDSAVLLLVGDGPLKNEMAEYAKSLGISDSVMFLGVREDIPELLQAFDIFVFPSLFEGLPVTLLEAQCSGLPCVVSDEVSNEVNITELIMNLSLNAPIENWSQAILKQKDALRSDHSSAVVQAGFDIKKASADLVDFYMKEAEKL